jgi:hypothetical protein
MWHAKPHGGARCWTLGALSVPFAGYNSPDTSLVAVADHALDPTARASFEHLVAVDNLLTERQLHRPPFVRAPAAMPPLLELRHLQIVNASARAAGDRWELRRQPLRMAWILGHADTVAHFEPGAFYFVPAARVWELFERHRDAPEAEQLAWAAATAPVFTDECFTDCVLSILSGSYARYWRAFPQGPHLAGALAAAVERARYAARFCVLVATGYLTLGEERFRQVAADLRESLTGVRAVGSDDLLALLADIERTCTVGAVRRLDDPEAIPGLVRALGAGFPMVSEHLASFGERAAPAVLDVVTAPAPELEAAYRGLVTLRLMVGGSNDSPLPSATLARVRGAAERWLTVGEGSLLTLLAAIDLAGVLNDPGLDRLLQTLASDRGAVVARGITSARSIEMVQSRSAEAVR